MAYRSYLGTLDAAGSATLKVPPCRYAGAQYLNAGAGTVHAFCWRTLAGGLLAPTAEEVVGGLGVSFTGTANAPFLAFFRF